MVIRKKITCDVVYCFTNNSLLSICAEFLLESHFCFSCQPPWLENKRTSCISLICFLLFVFTPHAAQFISCTWLFWDGHMLWKKKYCFIFRKNYIKFMILDHFLYFTFIQGNWNRERGMNIEEFLTSVLRTYFKTDINP